MFEGATVIPNQILYTLYILCAVSISLLLFLVTFIKGKIPEIVSIMKAELFKRPWVHIHTSLNQLLLFSPKRSGDDQSENCYDMTKFLGLKIVPNPEMVEHTENGRRIIHYYSKAAPPFTAKEAAACRDVIEHLQSRGIRTTESLVDALFIATDDELNNWYAENNPEMLELIQSLKLELQNKFIQDGQFVWEVVKDFIFAASNETSRSLDEFKSISHEQADERVRALTGGTDAKTTLMYGVIILFTLAIAYKIGFT